MSEGDEDGGVENVNVRETGTGTGTEVDTGRIAPTEQAPALIYLRRPHIHRATDIRLIPYLRHRKTSSPRHPIEPFYQNYHRTAASTGAPSRPPSIPTLTPILYTTKELLEPTPKLGNENLNGRNVNASVSSETTASREEIEGMGFVQEREEEEARGT